MNLSQLTANLSDKDKIKVLETEVGKLNALTQVMMKRMNFYEQQLELLVSTHDNEQLSKLLKRKNQLKTVDWKTNTTVQSMEEHYNLTTVWIDKLEHDRQYFQKRLSQTHVELKRRRQEQLQLQSRLFRKTQLPAQQESANTSNTGAGGDNNSHNNNNGKDDTIDKIKRTISSTSSLASSSLVDDMLDTWYTTNQLHNNPVTIMKNTGTTTTTGGGKNGQHASKKDAKGPVTNKAPTNAKRKDHNKKKQISKRMGLYENNSSGKFS